MIKTSWPTTINQKFYAFQENPKENVELSENLSGRIIGHKINSKSIMQYSFTIKFTKSELGAFWAWFNNILGQTSGAFTCSALGSGFFRFTEIPSPEDTNQTYREISCKVEQFF